jgi:hypothetical protein
MQQTFHTKTLITKGRKKSTRAAKYPLRGKPVIYRDPFKAASSDWEAMR